MKKLIKNQPDYDYIMSLESFRMDNSQFRNMLHNVEPGCYVQCEQTNQYGDIVKIFRNRDKVPVCFKVKGRDGIDYIAAEQVTYWEPRRFCMPDDFYSNDYDDMRQYLWDEDEVGLYYWENGEEVSCEEENA